MNDYDNIVAATATDLCSRLRSGELSSRQVTTAFLDRIEAENPRVHAVPIVRREEALTEADAADKQLADDGPLGPLHGLPMTIKDAFRVCGVRTTYGVPTYRNYVPKSDSVVVRRLKEAGAIIIGRSCVPFASFDWNCRNWHDPECVNPIDSTRVPGGSSGGAAAALARHMTPCELGSDIAGSIRHPAHCCGVMGLRTSDGLLPIDDVGPEDMPTAFTTLSTPGPMARNLPDLQLLLRVLHKEPELDKPPARIRIGWSDRVGEVVADEPTRTALFTWLDKQKRRHHVFEARPPVDDERSFRIWGHLAGYEYARSIPAGPIGRAFVSKYMLRYRLGSGPVTEYMSQGLRLDLAAYNEARAAQAATWATVDRFFAEQADLWVLPVSPGVAHRRMRRGRDIETPSGPIPYSRYLGAFLCPTAVYGTPALTLPVGTDTDNLPIAIQIHGQRFSDAALLQIAKGCL